MRRDKKLADREDVLGVRTALQASPRASELAVILENSAQACCTAAEESKPCPKNNAESWRIPQSMSKNWYENNRELAAAQATALCARKIRLW